MNKRAEKEIKRIKELEEERSRRLAEWAHGREKGPFKIMYYPTNSCNLSCSICWQRVGGFTFKELSLQRQKRLVNEANQLGVRQFVIGGGGEPLMVWKNLKPLVNKVKDFSMYGLMFTNGTLLDDEITGTLTQIGWDKVLVSLDGLKSANDSVRDQGSFNRIWKGLEKLIKSRGEKKKPVVGVGYVLTEPGINDLPKVIDRLGRLGVDQFNLIRLVVYQEEQRRFAVPKDRLKNVEELIRKGMEKAEYHGMFTNLEQYLDQELVQHTEDFESILLGERTLTEKGEKSFWNSLCFEPFSNIIIRPDGSAGPCCMSSEASVASLVDRSLADLWYGPEFTALREGMLARRPKPYCQECDINVFKENQRLREMGSSL